MAATNYALLVSKVRPEVDDGADGQLVSMETPKGNRDGTNALFKFDNKNIISGQVWYTYGTSYRQTSGFTLLDAVNGYVQITTPPDAEVTYPFFFDYRFLWYPDSDFNTWIDTATEQVGYAAGLATPEGLFPSVVSFTASKFYARRASDYAKKAMASGGGASENLNVVAASYTKLATEAYKWGILQRDDYYKRFSQREAPSSYTITQGVTSYQPRR